MAGNLLEGLEGGRGLLVEAAPAWKAPGKAVAAAVAVQERAPAVAAAAGDVCSSKGDSIVSGGKHTLVDTRVCLLLLLGCAQLLLLSVLPSRTRQHPLNQEGINCTAQASGCSYQLPGCKNPQPRSDVSCCSLDELRLP